MAVSNLSIGPLFFNWNAEKARDFYLRIADEAPVDTVYLGEVVCSKRQPFHVPYYAEVVERLQAAGKKVILSTLALVMNDRELDAIRDSVKINEMLFEANDLSAASLLAGKPHTIGPFINVYNEGTLKFFERRGAKIISLPSELSFESLKVLAKNTNVALEVQVFGRLPLAISSRCYHARANNFHKDSCQYVCGKDPDGLIVETMDGQDFLVANGTQTLSNTYCNLLAELDDLQDIGINNFRISPHDMDMVKICSIFRQALDKKISVEDAIESLQDVAGDATFSNGFFYGKVGREQISKVG